MFLLFCSTFAAGQNINVDSLEKVLSVAADDTNKVEILNKLSYALLYSDTAKVKKYDYQSLELSKRLNYTKGIALSYVSMGNTCFSISEYDKALKYYFLSYELALKNNYSKIILATNNGIACVYFANEEFAKAKQIYLRQLALNIKEIDEFTLFDYYNNLAVCYANLNNTDSSLYYYNQALFSARMANSTDKIILAKINMAATYKRKNELENALLLNEETLQLATEANKTYYIALINLGIGEIYDLLHDDSLALKYCKNSLAISDSMNYPNIRLSGLKILANVYLRLKNSQQVYNNLSSYISLKDSIQDDQKNKKIAELNAMYENAKKENDISKLKESLKNKKRFLVLVISLSWFLILTLTLSLLVLRLRQKNQRKEEILKQQEKLLLEKELEIKRNIEKELSTELENKVNEIKNNILSIVKLKNQRESLIEDFNKLKDFLVPEGLHIFTSISNMHKIDKLQIKISEFESSFEELNKEFFKALKERHPDLTPNEKKICAFISMKMTASEISEVTFQSENSIYVTRNRLKKKLNLVDNSLEDYLVSVLTEKTDR